MRIRKAFLTKIMLLLTLALAGCGPDKGSVENYMGLQHFVGNKVNSMNRNVEILAQNLNQNHLTNGILVQTYATHIKAKMLAEGDQSGVKLADGLGKEATVLGNLYKAQHKDATELTKRFNEITMKVDGNRHEEIAYKNGIEELKKLNGELTYSLRGSEKLNFNSSLGDIANSLASLSKGDLKYINVDYAQGAAIGAGAFLVGNTAYGYWKDYNGRKQWTWYDSSYNRFEKERDYDTNLYYFGSWSSSRPYTYHTDYRVRNYGKPSQKKLYSQALETPSALASKGKKDYKMATLQKKPTHLNGNKKQSMYAKGDGKNSPGNMDTKAIKKQSMYSKPSGKPNDYYKKTTYSSNTAKPQKKQSMYSKSSSTTSNSSKKSSFFSSRSSGSSSKGGGFGGK